MQKSNWQKNKKAIVIQTVETSVNLDAVASDDLLGFTSCGRPEPLVTPAADSSFEMMLSTDRLACFVKCSVLLVL